MSTARDVLLRRKIEQWDSGKKEDEVEWFPFGENQTPGSGSPNRKFESKTPVVTPTRAEEPAERNVSMERPSSQQSFKEKVTLQVIPPGAIPLAAYQQLQQGATTSQPSVHYQMPPYYYQPWQYPPNPPLSPHAVQSGYSVQHLRTMFQQEDHNQQNYSLEEKREQETVCTENDVMQELPGADTSTHKESMPSQQSETPRRSRHDSDVHKSEAQSRHQEEKPKPPPRHPEEHRQYYYPPPWPQYQGQAAWPYPQYPQYSFVPPGAYPIITHNPDGTPLCPVDVADQMASAHQHHQPTMGYAIPRPIPIPASMVASYCSDYSNATSTRERREGRPNSADRRSLPNDAEASSSEMTSSQSSAAPSHASSAKENQTGNGPVTLEGERKKKSSRLEYNPDYEESLRRQEKELEDQRREDARIQREREELEARRADEEEKARQKEEMRKREMDQRTQQFIEVVNEKSKESELLRKVKNCRHVLQDNPEVAEKLGVPLEKEDDLLKKVMLIEEQKNSSTVRRSLAPVKVTVPTQQDHNNSTYVNLDARQIRPAPQYANQSLTRGSDVRRSLRITNKEKAERHQSSRNSSRPLIITPSMSSRSDFVDEDAKNALFSQIPTRPSRMRQTLSTPKAAQAAATSPDGQRGSGSQSPDQNHNTSKTSPYEKAVDAPIERAIDAPEHVFKTPARPALRSPNYLNAESQQIHHTPATPRSMLRRMEEKGYKPAENTLTLEAIKKSEQEIIKRHGSVSSLRASMTDLRRVSNMSLAEREQSPRLNRFNSVTRASYDSMRLKKTTDKNRATLDRLAHLRDRLHTSDTATPPPARQGSFRSNVKFDGQQTSM